MSNKSSKSGKNSKSCKSRIDTLSTLVLLGLLTACASEPVQHTTYLLRSDQALHSRQLTVAADTYLGACAVADYLDQPGLVLHMGDGKVHVARYHQWAEPLRQSLCRFISTELSAQLGYDIPPDLPPSIAGQRVDITVDQLHGNAAGEAVLVASWRISQARQVTLHQFAETLPLDGEGYTALVSAEARLLEQLSARIATSLRD